ncbi:hypothetical protein [Lentilactobacillus kribbianus]|uniref:hypothetical protein n=1 Tax=Lentilactobacillus kribbianus TaxID=2729622 RepID=UPI0015516DA1|nr:hypothetical protein [Lentilactobacillus kribbianus]
MVMKYNNKYYEKLDRIQENIKTNEPELAQKMAAELYEDYPNKEVNRLLVHAASETGDYLAVISYLSDYPEQYQQNEAMTVDLVKAAQDRDDFISARKILYLIDPREEMTQVWHQLTQREADYTISHADTIAKTAKAFAHLGGKKHELQPGELVKANSLPLDSYVTSAKLVLQDPDVIKLIKTELLMTLKGIGETEIIHFQDLYNRSYELNLGELPPNPVTDTVNTIFKEVYNAVGNQDPIQLQMLQQTIMMYAVYLYPFIDKKIDNPIKFAHVLLSHLNGMDDQDVIAEVDGGADMLPLIKKLDQVITNDL